MKGFITTCILLLAAYTFGQQSTVFTFYFETNQATFSEKKFIELEKLIDTVEVLAVNILTSCDDVGSEESNLVLSQRRADFLMSYLRKNKKWTYINIQSKALGEIALKDTTISIQNQRTKNRKGEVRLTYRLIESIEKEEIVAVQVNESALSLTNVVKGEKIRLEAIQFVGGKDEFLSSAYPVLNEMLNQLKSNPNVKIEIQGHVCCMTNGEEGENLVTGRRTLSEDRARAVYNYLIHYGISKDRLSYVGLKGQFQTGVNNLADRRVEILIK
ncbi:OmpA family protein [Lishizhenia tianjinensis]|uniref:OmpA family protein n=1 Tax=Lishizhenia tianjinensis TaxID=477690 RepID=A0A1I7BWH7_9FLAO|nr:OmpA family protein [Lishizhenia tianjinensis]SFT91500.1 OmpA family protein [Lishizhenia tianjinensis]